MTPEKEKQIRRKLVEYIWKAKLSAIYKLAQQIEIETGLKIID
jgi:hypothetical protein